MRLHRLTLTNYRGIDHREVAFPDHGVVVISGVNEVGKSSMIQALDLLLKFKDRSGHKDVKAAKPTHADVGSEVTAEISTGPYRFVYHKRFHKRAETTLSISAPRREQLTGDEAHDRVCAILDETVDTALWEAQRVLQAESTDAVDLAGCDALSKALDIAAGEAATLTGAEGSLIEDIDVEYGRYFTPTAGRATAELATATTAFTGAQAERDRCARLVEEVDDRVCRHDELTEQLESLTEQQQDVTVRHTAAQEVAALVAELKNTLQAAELAAARAESSRSASETARSERQRLRTDLDTRTQAVAGLEAQAKEAADAEAAGSTAAEEAGTAADETAQRLAAAEQRVRTARRVVDQLVSRDEEARLADRLTKIDTTQLDHDRVCDELAGVTLTEAMLVRIEEAATAADRAQAALTAISTTVEFTAIADIDLQTGDQQMTLPAGQSWSTIVSAATRVEVPGVLTVQIGPGENAGDAQAKAAVAQQELTAALAAAQEADVASARRADRHRQDLCGRRDQLAAALDALRGDDHLDELRARLDRLRADRSDPAPQTGADIGAARAELDAAEQDRDRVAAEHETLHRAAAEATEQLGKLHTETTMVQAKLQAQRTELTTTAEKLAAERAQISDDDLAAAAGTARQAADAATENLAELSRQLQEANPEAVDQELTDATAGADALRKQCDETAGKLRDVRVELDLIGTEGRQSQLDAAEADLEHAADAHARVDRRARAAKLLRTVMLRHRDDTRLRYVEPLRVEITRLGAPVFGESFEVEVDSQLSIRSRTLDGRTVPYESLSGGAKEQLGILVRLAAAALVAKEDSVPVLIDDALGFTDAERLISMGEVLSTVGEHGQVIVLTCTPERYDGVKDAHRIDLSG